VKEVILCLAFGLPLSEPVDLSAPRFLFFPESGCNSLTPTACAFGRRLAGKKDDPILFRSRSAASFSTFFFPESLDGLPFPFSPFVLVFFCGVPPLSPLRSASEKAKLLPLLLFGESGLSHCTPSPSCGPVPATCFEVVSSGPGSSKSRFLLLTPSLVRIP